MSQHAEELLRIAARIVADEDFAMRIGEDARAALEAEGLPDPVIAQVLSRAEADVVGFAMPSDHVGPAVARIAQAARLVATA